jgi:hypothetical protein
MDYFLINNDFKLIKDDENRSWSGSVNIYKSIKSYFKEFDNYNITLNVEKTSTDEDIILIQINIKIADIFKNKKNKFSLEKSSFSLFRTKKAILDFYNIDTDLKILSNLKFLEILHFLKSWKLKLFLNTIIYIFYAQQLKLMLPKLFRNVWI